MQKHSVEELIKAQKGSVIDVRTPAEFMGGHVVGAINIPLDEIPEQMDRLKELPSPLILCCASGNRSAQAERFLAQYGVECVNGGSWLDVNYLKNNLA